MFGSRHDSIYFCEKFYLMKRFIAIALFMSLLTACQNEPKKEKSEQKEPLQSAKWILNEDASSIHWTGYKTTGKIPVKGVFQNFKIKGTKTANDLATALKQAQAEINIYSVFSNNEDRDKKLISQLFEKMTATKNIYARIEKIDTATQTALVTINMNAHEKQVPMSISIDDKNGMVTLKGTIDLVEDFGASKALETFHKTCFDKHTGNDGVSKTWSEVSVEADLKFDKK